MSTSPAVQEARKKMQLARLEQKGKKGYASYYAKQPYQVERARLNAEHQVAQQTLRDAIEALEIATITGVGLETATKAHAIAALVVERSKPPGRGAGASAGLRGA